MKKTIAILLSLLLLFAAASAAPFAAAEDSQSFAAGDIIEYGTYPQSRVTDESLLAVLPTLPGEWKHFGEYSVSVNYTFELTGNRYIDVVYQNTKYRGVIIDDYKPFSTPVGAEMTTQEMNGYLQGGTYWFKYEPLRWRVLDPQSGLVMSSTLIDSQPFVIYMEQTYAPDFYEGEYGSSTYVGHTASGEEYHAGWWRTVSEWLNEDFMSTSFSAAQQENIKPDTQTNDYWYTGNDAGLANYGVHKYDAPQTNDKIFLPSWDALCNTSYGFNGTARAADPARALKSTDYAKMQGIYVARDGAQDEICSSWIMRTTDKFFNTIGACFVSQDGTENSRFPNAGHRSCWYGICPMMYMEELVNESEGNALLHPGDNFYFGAYPQSRVTDESVIARLNERLPNAQQHRRSMYLYDWHYTAEICVDYADMILDGHKYRAKIEYMNLLAPPTGNNSVQEYTDYDYHYTDGETEKYVSYYLFEPLLWRVLEPESGLVMCEGIVEQLVFQNVHIPIPDPNDPDETYWYADAWGNEEQTRYATDYAISNIRPFLNNDFFGSAFSASQQAKILTTTLDNRSLWTVSGETGYERYDWVSTTDKVFLLSASDVLNPDYGFSADKSAKDSARVLTGNDYAGYNNPKSFNAYWLLRNAAYELYPGRRPAACTYHGMVGSTGPWANELQAICPAIYLTEIDNDLSGANAVCESHEPSVVPVTPATCIAAGSGNEVCALCGEVLTENVVIPALGHDIVRHEGKTPTCGEAGWEAYETCTRCDHTTYQALQPTGEHSWIWVTDQNETCGAAGFKHEACSVCTLTRNENTVIPPNGNHTPGEVKQENVVGATCTQTGSFDEVTYCGVCGQVISSVHQTSGLLRHVSGASAKENEVAATCTKEGSYDSVVRCVKCQTVLNTEHVTVPKNKHTPGAAVQTDVVAATCTAPGSYTEVIRCTVCQNVISSTPKTTALAPHTFGNWVGEQSATCVKTGVKGHYQCSVCKKCFDSGKNEIADLTIAKNANNHVNTSNVAAVASTCTVKGYSAGVYCSDCKKYVSGHTEQALAAHKAETRNARAADCLNGGYTGDRFCTVCRQKLSSGSATGALGHTSPDGNGNCTRCGTHIKDVTPPTTQQQQPSGGCKYCGQNHSGFPGILIGFFHTILALFGLRK